MNGHPGIDTTEATQHLKDILNVGKTESHAVRVNTVINGTMDMTERSDTSRFNGENILETLFNKSSAQKQQIILSGDDEQVSFNIYGEDVTIIPSPTHHNSSSSKIKIHNVVDFGWEKKSYSGRVVSVHLSGAYLAYAIRVPSSSSGMVRVMNHTTGERALIKGLNGEVKDLAFAHITSRKFLACVDEVGSLFMHEIIEEGRKIICKCMLHVTRPSDTKPSDNHRIIWCPYIPEDLGSLEDIADNSVVEDVATLLVVTHDEQAEMWNVDTVLKEYAGGEITPDKVKVGLQKIAEHRLPITAASFSPDGTALATASLDGEVKFFQVYLQDKDTSPRCLHQWRPHDGKPLSSLFFLDNHKNPSPDVQFWKFAITGANSNQELKLWSCETWTCLQTIRFILVAGDGVQPCLKAELDLSASYLILSDICRRVLYVLQIHQEPSTSQALIYSISEFSLTLPVLSFAVIDVSQCKLKSSLCTEHLESAENEDRDIDGEDDVNSGEKYVEGTVAKLFWINTKSLQMCRIVYQPVVSPPLQPAESVSSLSQESFACAKEEWAEDGRIVPKRSPLTNIGARSASKQFYRDRLSDLSMDAQETVPKQGSESDINLESGVASVLTSRAPPLPPSNHSPMSSLTTHLPNYKGCSEILLTPDDFTSPSHITVSSAVSTSFSLTPVEEVSCTTPVKAAEKDKRVSSDQEEVSSVPNEENTLPRRKSSQHSSTSSPSREVAEIMAPTKMINDDHDQDEEALEENKTEGRRVDTPSDKLCEHTKSLSSDEHRRHEEYSDWPQAPDPTKEYRVVGRSNGETNLQQSVREQRTVINRHLKQTSCMLEERESSPTNERNYMLYKVEHFLDQLSHSWIPLKEMLHTQRQKIQDLEHEIQELQQQQKYIQSHLKNLENMENVVCAKVEHVITQQLLTSYGRLEASLSKKDDFEHQLIERQTTSISQTLPSAINSRVEKTLKNELKSNILPHVSKYIESLKDQWQSEISHKLSATDNSIKENLNKLIKNKAFCDNLSQNVVTLLQPQVQSCCREVFQSSVIPAFDKACHNLFLQLNESFQRGTMEYLQQIERQRQMTQTTADGMVSQLREQLTKLQTSTETLLHSIPTRVQEQTKEVLAKQQEVLLSEVKTLVQEEVRLVLREQNMPPNSFRSRTVTPVPQAIDPHMQQQQIMQLIKQGQYNAAFQQALSAADLNLVLFVCEHVSPNQVFSQTPCPLQQPVLLSLIHQLSGDLSTQAELKVRFIEEAIMNLDRSSPVTRNHIGTVLGALQQKLTTFLQNNPTHSVNRNLKMLLMAIQSFLSC